MKENKIKVYIKTDEQSRIIEINSSIFLSDVTEYIEIDEGNGDKYAHAQGMYLEKPLVAEDGTHNYIYEDSIRESTEEERETERLTFPVTEPVVDMQTQIDQVIANIDFISAMTGVELI